MDDRVVYRSMIADSRRWDGFEVREGDVVVCTPPKSGTTWMQTVVALLLHDGWPSLAVQTVSPWLEATLEPVDEVLERLAAQPGRRVIKTHTPPDGLPPLPGADVVVVARDPRDVLASMLDHMRNTNFEQLYALRLSAVGEDEFTPAAETGPPPDMFEEFFDPERGRHSGSIRLAHVSHHLRLAWERRHDARWHLFHYVDLLDDLRGEVRRLAGLLDVDLPPQRLDELADETTLESMRGRAAETAPGGGIGYWYDDAAFFAKARRGTGVRLLDEQQRARYDAMVAELLPDPDLRAWIHDGRLATGVDVGD